MRRFYLQLCKKAQEGPSLMKLSSFFPLVFDPYVSEGPCIVVILFAFGLWFLLAFCVLYYMNINNHFFFHFCIYFHLWNVFDSTCKMPNNVCLSYIYIPIYIYKCVYIYCIGFRSLLLYAHSVTCLRRGLTQLTFGVFFTKSLKLINNNYKKKMIGWWRWWQQWGWRT